MLLNTQVFEGVQALIDAIQVRAFFGAWSPTSRCDSPIPLTRAMPLFASAGAVVSGDTTPHAKPHPEPLHEAARRLGVPSEACIYVGDDERDIIAGRAAGMRTVAATYGYMGSQADATLWQADASISSPMGLLHLLDSA
jgi:phosphoglycolate phosphatase-like HAD superfamily hydrolase